MIKDFKPISQESLNNSEWAPIQTYSGAIAVIAIAVIATLINW